MATYGDLSKGKIYDIQVFKEGSSTIGKVVKKEKSTKTAPGSLLIEFTRPSTVFIKGVATQVEPQYQCWVMGNYDIYSYKEVGGSARAEAEDEAPALEEVPTEEDMAPAEIA